MRRRWRRLTLLLVAALCAAGSILTFASQASTPSSSATSSATTSTPAPPPALPSEQTKAVSGARQPQPPPDPQLVTEGRALFEEGCVSCHGFDARGIQGTAPSLYGVGAASADFYLSTGRMPLNRPGDQPVSAEPRYDPGEIDALVAYVASLGGGPPIPVLDPASANLEAGNEAFATHCAGCHQAVARGGDVGSDAFAPSLTDATPTQIAEAARVGPYVMPVFTQKVISGSELNSLTSYVQYTQHPDDAGGWAIGDVGPIPEGMIAWFLAIVALLAVSRLIGERIDQ